MIIAQTKLKKIPEKCLKCKFCIDTGCLVKKAVKENGYIGECYRQKRCFLIGAEVPYIFNKAKRNWEYTKCKKCPLQTVEDMIEGS